LNVGWAAVESSSRLSPSRSQAYASASPASASVEADPLNVTASGAVPAVTFAVATALGAVLTGV
jgi:hypothetical protein